jgi:DNA polymerase III epsilon subunit-like protein
MEQSVDQQLLVCLDSETTGLSCYNDHIIQLAACTVPTDPSEFVNEDGTMEILPNPKQSFASFVHTDRRIPKVITDLTGIDSKMIQSAPQFDVVWENFRQWLISEALRCSSERSKETGCDIGDMTVNVCLAAHNGLRFDFPMIFSELLRFGMNLDALTFEKMPGCPLIRITNLSDTLPVFRKVFPKRSNYKLGSIHQFILGREIENAHNALADVYAMRSIIISCEIQDRAGHIWLDVFSTGQAPVKAWDEVDARRLARQKLRGSSQAPTISRTGRTSSTFTASTRSTESANVYVTATGKKYHKFDCTWCHKGKSPPVLLSLQEALSKKLTACSACNPSPPRTTSEHLPGTGLRAEPTRLRCDVQATTANNSQDPNEAMVFITLTGKKYHQHDCSCCHRGKSAPSSISMTEAKSRSLLACSMCFVSGSHAQHART